MRVRELLENVVDGEDRFRQKRAADAHQKLVQLAADVPKALARQEELEAHVRAELERIEKSANAKFKSVKLELAPMFKDYKKDTPILTLIWFGSEERAEHHDLIVSFFKKHEDMIVKAVTEYAEGLDTLKRWANEQKWPTGAGSLTRFTRFGYVEHEYKMSIAPAIKKLTKEVAAK